MFHELKYSENVSLEGNDVVSWIKSFHHDLETLYNCEKIRKSKFCLWEWDYNIIWISIRKLFFFTESYCSWWACKNLFMCLFWLLLFTDISHTLENPAYERLMHGPFWWEKYKHFHFFHKDGPATMKTLMVNFISILLLVVA